MNRPRRNSVAAPAPAASVRRRRALSRTVLGAALTLAWMPPALAGVTSSGALTGGDRWDAAPRNVPFLGERSLNGGLRYNMQGGSFTAYRNLFTWSGTAPTAAQFEGAVRQAFAAWESVDPVSGFGTSLRFVRDSDTPVRGISTGGGVFDRQGAEIDLFGWNSASRWVAGNTQQQAETSVGTLSVFDVADIRPALTSTGARYNGAASISGADIIMNTGATWTLDVFRRLLTHEIGNAIGLHDVDVPAPVRFIDDNYSAANPAATLSNSWAHLVNPLNPATSAGLAVYINPNVGAAGVDLLMESNGLGIGATNPVTRLVPLTNDEYGIRQFLYPQVAPVPEPHTWALLAGGLAAVIVRVRGRRTAGDQG